METVSDTANRMDQRITTVRAATTVGIDMGKNTLHMVGLDSLGAIVLRERVSRGRITLRSSHPA
jgi:hypothetical protein